MNIKKKFRIVKNFVGILNNFYQNSEKNVK